MFEKRIDDIEKEIRKLEIWRSEIIKKQMWIMKKIEEVKITYRGPHKNLYEEIVKELYEKEEELLRFERDMDERMKTAYAESNEKIVDVTRVDPRIVKEYMRIKKEWKELKDQVRHLEKLSEEEKNHELLSLGDEFARLIDKRMKVDDKIFSLKRGKR